MVKQENTFSSKMLLFEPVNLVENRTFCAIGFFPSTHTDAKSRNS